MRFLVAFLLFYLLSNHCFSQDVHATVNLEESRLTIHSPTDIDYEESRSITIHSEEGNDLARIAFFESEVSSLKYVEVVVKSATGQVIDSYSKRNFSRETVIRGYAYYENILRYDLNCAQNTFPYTIEISSLLNFSSIFNMSHKFTTEQGVHTVSSLFTVEHPSEMAIEKILTKGHLIHVDSIVDSKTKRFDYRVDIIEEYNYQPYSKYDNHPLVQIIPSTYSYGGIEGEFSSWSAYGLWLYKLWSGRNELPKNTKKELDILLVGKASDFDKAEAIYKYVQQKMRYVYVGYGNGAIQTMTAFDTYKLGYGDCKSLTNFTNAAMTYAGIESYPALVEAGANHTYFDQNKPQDPFNHVILVLPTIGDSTWLECTSKNAPFGYISNFTDDRSALVFKPSGGQLVKTPVFSESDNYCERHFEIDLKSDGSASIQFEGLFSNQSIKKTAFYSKENSSTKAIDVVKREMRLASFDLVKYESEIYPDDLPQLNVTIDVEARLFTRKVGTKLMVKPYIGNHFIPYLDSTATRTVPLYFKRGYTIQDSIKLNLPSGYSIKDVHDPVVLVSNYGALNIHCTLNDDLNELWIHRKIVLNKGEFPVEEYAPICRFFQKLKDTNDIYFILEND